MQTSAIEKFSIFFTLTIIVMYSSACANAQVVTADQEQRTLGTVVVGNHPISVSIAYQADSALLTASIPGTDGKPKYIPLLGSTYRGISSFQLDVLSTSANDEIWIQMAKPRSEVLAHYRFGANTALTPFGSLELLNTPFPDHISGGPVAFPKQDSNTTQLRASFFHYDQM